MESGGCCTFFLPFLNLSTFISLSLCLWLVYLFQSLIYGDTSLGYFFLYFRTVLFFLILLPNGFQTNEKKTVSFRSLVFLSYSINLPFSFAKHILRLSIISDCFSICLIRNNTFTKNEAFSLYLF